MDRRSYLGSSDAAAVMGLSPWKTPIDVWLEKTSKTPLPDNDSTVKRRGRRAEPYIIEWLQEERDVWVVDRNVRVNHQKYSFLAAESDYTYVIDGSLPEPIINGNIGHGEAKSVGEFADWGKWGEEGTQEVPDYYIVQALFAIECNEMPETTIAAGFGWDKVRTYRFERDLELGAAIVQKMVDFWNNYVVARIPPPMATLGDTKALLKRYGSFDWQASEEALRIAGEATALRRSIKALEEQRDAKDKDLLSCLYSAAQAVGVEGEEFKKAQILGPDGKPVATFSEIARKGYEVKPTTFTTLRFAKETA